MIHLAMGADKAFDDIPAVLTQNHITTSYLTDKMWYFSATDKMPFTFYMQAFNHLSPKVTDSKKIQLRLGIKMTLLW